MLNNLSNFSNFPSILIIPSGIGCEIGGYAGDAIPAARLLAAVSGCLITHPNVMNGGSLYWSDPRIQYVEGYSLDKFALGELALRPVRQQKIGLLLDAGLNEELRQRHIQVAEGCRATLGLNIGPIEVTDTPLEVNPTLGASGASWGEIGYPDSLLRSGQLLKDSGATAIAVVTYIPDVVDSHSLDKYRSGEGVDSIAGLEALISHLLVSYLQLPCAHAPGMCALPLVVDLDPRAAAEEIGYTFLPSVLIGLNKAPDLVERQQDSINASNQSSGLIDIDHVGAVIAPHGALGGEGVLACLERDIPLIAVNNPSILNITQESLSLGSGQYSNSGCHVLNAQNYVEAAGLLTLLKEGISIESLYRPFNKME